MLCLLLVAGCYIFCKKQRETANISYVKKLQTTAQEQTFSKLQAKNDTFIFDSRTKLYWMPKIKDEVVSFKKAEEICTYSNYGGFTDWRLPTVYELATISTKCSSTKEIEKWNVKKFISDSELIKKVGFCTENQDMPRWKKVFGFTSNKYLWTTTSHTSHKLPSRWVVKLNKNITESRPCENNANVICVRK